MAERDVKPRPLTFYAERGLTRFLGPELRTFAAGIVAGTTNPTEVAVALTAKLTQVSENVNRHGALQSFEQLKAVIPTPAAVGAETTRLPRDVVERILALRAEGKSKRAIAKALGKPNTTIHHVLRREGDPAPQAMKDADVARKKREIERLQRQLAELEPPK